MRRIILVGPPRSGKSTEARALREQGIPTFCTDERSMVKEPEEGVTYMHDGLSWSETSQYVADNWFTMSGEFCIEGVATVRALRKYLASHDKLPKDCIIQKFSTQYGELKNGQKSMAKSIDTIWGEIAPLLK